MEPDIGVGAVEVVSVGEERRGRRGLFFVLAFVQIGHFLALKIIAKTTRDTRLRLKRSKRQGKK